MDADTSSGVTVKVAGRIMTLRRHGGLVFATIRDSSGDLQLFVPRNDLGEEAFGRFAGLDMGDVVGVTGEVVCTRRGELSVQPADFVLLCKSLLPLPDKWHGLQDVETRSRQRYLDLIVNPEARRIAHVRSRAIAAIRRLMIDRGFMEVEGPVLQTQPGGAEARPFVTHHNALDIDMYMRIALELHLKRLVVGGLERVFEMGRVFRNEGIDTRHNPEFTMLESYSAYDDYHDMMELTEAMVSAAALATAGTTSLTYQGRPLDLTPPWERLSMEDALARYGGVEMTLEMPLEELRRKAAENGVEAEDYWGPGRIVSEAYDALCERHLWGPVFICDHPAEVSPLARAHRSKPGRVERFEVVIGGRELANAYTEQNDPLAQRAALEAQQRMRVAGDEEAERIDEDFLTALEYGMPPTGGLGVGIDRLVMLLADVDNIRDVILFPTLRPLDGARGLRPLG